ncbi:MAG: hypothetical protein DLM67_08350 [Candidatus Nephthysia bennettiae]|uniref:Uncharacterized protein n=1 Tax=Candidatus Nephthysia bennettiae TaxID=3127016 RepID=A0A934K418_9BACT|nr:hypothetical protein [Candidatus Dormibacteraeota bacterium]MBJ7612861.1 hypothetical protein [Candidatus Dormibacteraeota bacterium]PZR97294.1 MAG: hypothetical protein DLM67_08350 [Candidatus Dormibacteraeota bacterium]
MLTTLGLALAVVVALGLLAVLGAALGLAYLINLPVGTSRRLPKAAAGLDVRAIARALDEAVQMTSGRLPSDIQVRVTEIRREIIELLPRTAAFPLGSEDLYVIERTATDYLPSTLRAYLALPEASAATLLPQVGKTPLQLLREQVQLLDDRLDEITEAVRTQDADQLIANGRFLEERFGQRAGGLALPPEESEGSIGPSR